MRTLEFSSRLAASADDVWTHATSFDGVNAELAPWLRMTVPLAVRGMTLAELPPDSSIGRSWLLAGGVLPVEYDALRIAELGPQRRFVERSTMATMRVWSHERSVVAREGGGCEIRDRLGFEPRRLLAATPGAERAASAITAAVFRHRHAQLARLFGAR